MFSNQELIDIFEETRELSRGIYREETTQAVKDTRVIVNGAGLLKEKGNKKQIVELNNLDSISTALGVVASKIAILNFADPFTEGGLVFQGEFTQEECLCRCTNLYETLIKEECYKFYYKYNQDLGGDIFSNRIIYSPNILVLKDSTYNIVPQSPKVDIITCPAPISCTDIEIFKERIKCIFGTAYNHGVDILILGKFGTGAFDNDPKLVAQAFKEVLDEYKLFDKVIFPLFDDSDSTDIFKKVLGGV